MGGTNSKANPSSSTTTVKTTEISSNADHKGKHIVPNFILIWVDVNLDKLKVDYTNNLTQLQAVVGEVNVFKQPDECIDFLNTIQDEKVVLITSGSLGRHLVSDIHELPQIDAIYIFCHVKSHHGQWTKQWPKIKGVYTTIKPICQALERAVKQYYQDAIAISFVSANEEISSPNLNQLESTFMYTDIFKEILFDLEYTDQSIKDLANYCRKIYAGNKKELDIINEFENNYRLKTPIWWYTRECFTYQMVNRALRTLEVDTIINMGFFIHDLHEELRKLHREQVGAYHGKTFILYRGQGLLKPDFEKLSKLKGSLMSFNNFLSTSKTRSVSLHFAKNALGKENTVGILFHISIDSSIVSTPYASIRNVSFFKTEDEILFSMHSVFRVTEITKIDKEKPLYQIDLKLTADDDPELRAVTEKIRQEIDGETGLERVGKLLLKIGKYNKAEELYKVFLEQTSDELKKASYYYCLGSIKNWQGDYKNALEYHEKAIEIRERILSSDDPQQAVYYAGIAHVYHRQGQYAKAIAFTEKALEIKEKTLPPADVSLGTSYVNIAEMYRTIADYSKALSYFEKGYEILQKALPPNHPSLASCHGYIAGTYADMEDFPKSLELYLKELEIMEKTLPPDHPSLATSYGNVGGAYMRMRQYSTALSYYEKTLAIQRKSLTSDHPQLATILNNMGYIYSCMNDKSKALLFYEEALEIGQKVLPEDHPDLAHSYNNIGSIYFEMNEYQKAFPFWQKNLEINEKTLPPGHPVLGNAYNNLAYIYEDMKDYSQALIYYEKVAEITEKMFSPTHHSLGRIYNNIGMMYNKMEDYTNLILYCEKARSILEKNHPLDHPDLIEVYHNLAFGYSKMQDYPTALSLYEKVIEYKEKILSSNDLSLANPYDEIGDVYQSMGESSRALMFFEKALEIKQNNFDSNNAALIISFAKITGLYMAMGEYAKAMSYLGNVPDLLQAIAPSEDQDRVQDVKDAIDSVNRNLINKNE
jgi:tetratricopeptide (TPR) repeat protein